MELIILYFVGLVATTIGTLAGGGGLISLPAMMLLGIPVHSAIGANKFSNTFSSFSSFLMIYRKKEVSKKEALIVFPISLVGGITGGILASAISENLMYWLAIVLLGFALLTSFLGKGSFTGTKSLTLSKKTSLSLYGIGIYDGLFGPGQGTLMMYLFSHLKFSYLRSVGLARIATFSSCFGASISFIATDKIIWPLTIALLFGSLSGARVGIGLASKMKKHQVKLVLRIVTIALLIQIVLNNVIGVI
jgi:uncharacterized protein